MSFDICGFFIKRILQGTIGGLGTTTIPSIESDKSTKVLWDSTGALLKKNKTDACLPDVSKCLTFFCLCYSRPRLGQALQYDMDLECHVVAYPPPAITWWKDEVQLSNNQHYRFI